MQWDESANFFEMFSCMHAARAARGGGREGGSGEGSGGVSTATWHGELGDLGKLG